MLDGRDLSLSGALGVFLLIALGADAMAQQTSSAEPFDPVLDVTRRLQETTGSDPVVCGRFLRKGGPATAATAKELGHAVKCARGAARRRTPFWLLVEMEGIDSWVATGLLARSDGQIHTFRYDSDPSGGSGLPPRFSVDPCERLTSSETPSITQVTCIEPGDSP